VGTHGITAVRTFRQSAEHVARRLLCQARQLGSALEEAHNQPHAARLQRRLEVRVRQRLRTALVEAPVVRPGAVCIFRGSAASQVPSSIEQRFCEGQIFGLRRAASIHACALQTTQRSFGSPKLLLALTTLLIGHLGSPGSSSAWYPSMVFPYKVAAAYTAS